MTRKKIQHLTELRTAVGAVHRLATGKTFSFETVLAAQLVRATHMTELRSILASARMILGLPALTFGEGIGAGTTIKASHVEELRAGVK
jgi:hypothetical protein